MDFVMFVVLFVSLIGNLVFAVVGVCLWKFVVPPTAMLMIRKKLGSFKDSMLAFVCYDDGVAIVKALRIKHEGCLESDVKNGVSETYYIAKPTEDTDDAVVNRANYELDRVTLPFISVDGIPIALCYALDGVTANANTLLALQTASMVDKGDSKSLSAVIKVPDSGGKGVSVFARIKVLLPINPLDIHRAFKQYWDQSMLHATKQRCENIGAEKSMKSGKDHFKFMMVVGLIACIGLAVAGVVAGRFI